MKKLDQIAIELIKVNREGRIEVSDQLAVEEPLEIRMRYTANTGTQVVKRVAVSMRTPGKDEDLIRGFFYTEGIINDFAEIDHFVPLEEHIVEVVLKEGVQVDEDLLDRNFYTSSSCGVCGKASIESVQVDSQFLPWTSKMVVADHTIQKIYRGFNQVEGLFTQTGGNHMVALANLEGEIVETAEDVGRHNALDKLLGKSTLPLFNNILIVSGRASFELIQKASKGGIPIFLAIGAPSSLAVQLAKEQGMTLLGFLKAESYNIYTRADRIILST